jgi:hypothetical protein
MNAFYGCPDSRNDGAPDPHWEAENIVRFAPPYPMVLAWAPATPVNFIRCHRLVADSLQHVLAAIRSHYGSDEALRAARMHLYGGAYQFRMMRGAHQLSIHSWGAAIDLDPERNAFGRHYDPATMMPRPVIDAFASEGWVWGGRWSTPDAMHFQAATV